MDLILTVFLTVGFTRKTFKAFLFRCYFVFFFFFFFFPLFFFFILFFFFVVRFLAGWSRFPVPPGSGPRHPALFWSSLITGKWHARFFREERYRSLFQSAEFPWNKHSLFPFLRTHSSGR